MELREFVALVPHFSGLSHPERVKHFGWYLHNHRSQERFNQGDIRKCYVDADMEPPNITKEFGRLQARTPRELLKDATGYRLEHRIRQDLDKRYGVHATTVVVSDLLKDLPGKISDDAERLFLSESVKCYKAEAFRAVIVMTWNLAYDHVLNWLLSDPQRLGKFNSKVAARVGPKRGGLQMKRREDFEDLKESEVLDICGTAGVFPSDNIKKILDMQLTKRNLAAHPSLIEMDRPSADDAIFSLVSNVVLKLK
jgi:hypothetical protein